MARSHQSRLPNSPNRQRTKPETDLQYCSNIGVKLEPTARKTFSPSAGNPVYRNRKNTEDLPLRPTRPQVSLNQPRAHIFVPARKLTVHGFGAWVRPFCTDTGNQLCFEYWSAFCEAWRARTGVSI